jgi:hypothetical protein
MTREKIKQSKIQVFYVSYPILRKTLNYLKSQGRYSKECTTFWCGKIIENNKAVITSCIRPKQHATLAGARVEASEVARIYLWLHEKRNSLLAQIHSHPTSAFHSSIDNHYPIVYKEGLLSIVVPFFGFIKQEDFLSKTAMYEYSPELWRRLSSDEIKNRLKIMPKNFNKNLFERTKLLINHYLKAPSNELLYKFKRSTIALTIDEKILYTQRGQCMLVASLNLLSRCCINIDIFLPESYVQPLLRIPLLEGNLAEGLEKVCIKINPNGTFQVNPIPRERYITALIIGEDGGINADKNVYINALNWLSYVSTERPKRFNGDSVNPIGPLIACSLGSSEVFKILLNRTMRGEFKPLRSVTFSGLDYNVNSTRWDNPTLPDKITLNDVCLAGSGALGMSTAYTLASLPALSGKLTVIDPEQVEVSNLNRYILATIMDVGSPKVNVIKQVLRNKLEVEAFKGTYQEYYRRNQLNLVVVAVDNVKTRWDVQLDFPNTILNGGMFANSFTISRHDNFLKKACLGCLYPGYSGEIDATREYPAISFTSMFAGALLGGEILKERLSKLRKFRLDNVFMVNDVFATPKIGETYLLGRFKKINNCGCHCKSPKVIEAYKSRTK